ncbi:uncharacterized protein L201_005006 [Kwoniella dendrophila CBS 6074]|uniref:Mitochondrial transcription factor 1 n=1 Tax=Kwoniella dendrophila CBS 6074 TaxID=1295534 RepID=A0AAX4JZX4_9TREE
MSKIINRIPPLPPAKTWSKHFPSKYLPNSPDRNMIRKSIGRKLLANQSMCDEFVKSLKIRKDEIIIEGYSGVGNLTRSLLSGGNSLNGASKLWNPSLSPKTDQQQEEDQILSSSSDTIPAKKTKKKSTKKDVTYPSWLEDLPTYNQHIPEQEQSDIKIPNDNNLNNKPKLVVSTEGSLEILTRSMNYSTKNNSIPLSLTGREISSDPYTRPVPIIKSSLHENLYLSHSTVYVWPTLPKILENPLIQKHLPIIQPDLPPGSIESTKRNWDDKEPPITVVCQLPDSSIGEQLAAQWIGSAVGDPDQKRTWIWEWGRIRLALLCGKSLYDRILAPPASIIHCKLSILTQALFDIVPLPPYHHVANIDKQSKFTHDRPIKPLSEIPPSSIQPNGIPNPSESSCPSLKEFKLNEHDWSKRTTSYPLDFYPPSTSAQRLIGKPLDRPELLGLLLIPKVQSPILSSQKDVWDFVMRRLFVRDTLSLKQALPNLSFGADTLIKQIEEQNDFRGIPVNPERIIRDLNVHEWLRIVDVFDQWAFKPDNLILDSGSPDETSREVGQD